MEDKLKRYVAAGLIMCLLAFVELVILYWNTVHLSVKDQNTRMAGLLDEAELNYETKNQEAETDAKEIYQEVWYHMYDLADMLTDIKEASLPTDPAYRAMRDINSGTYQTDMACLVIDSEGRIVLAPYLSEGKVYAANVFTEGESLLEIPGVTEATIELICAGTDKMPGADPDETQSPLETGSENGEYFLYSKALTDGEGKETGYTLVIVQIKYYALYSVIESMSIDSVDQVDDAMTILQVSPVSEDQELFWGESSFFPESRYYKLADLGFSMADLQDGSTGMTEIDGTTYYYYIRIRTSSLAGDKVFIGLWKNEGGWSKQYSGIYYMIYAMCCLAMVYYAWTVRRDPHRKYRREDYRIIKDTLAFDRVNLQQMMPVYFLLLVIMSVTAVSVASMSAMTQGMKTLKERAENVCSEIEVASVSENDSREKSGQSFAEECFTAAYYVEAEGMEVIRGDDTGNKAAYYAVGSDGHTARVKQAYGGDLICQLDCADVRGRNGFWTQGTKHYTIYDGNGYAIFTSGSSRPARITSDDESYDVLMRNKKYFFTSEENNYYTYDTVYVPITLYSVKDGENGIRYITWREKALLEKRGEECATEDGMIVFTRYVIVMGQEDKTSLNAILGNKNGLYAVVGDDEQHTAYYMPTMADGVKLTTDMFPEDAFKALGYGRITVGTTNYLYHIRYFASTNTEAADMGLEQGFLIALMPESSVYADTATEALLPIATTAVVLMAFIMYISACRADSIRVDAPGAHSGEKRLKSTRYERLRDWKHLEPEQKLSHILQIVTIPVTIWLAMRYNAKDTEETAIAYLLNKKWETGFNTFSLTGILIAVVVAVSLTYLMKQLLGYIASSMEGRSRTVMYLVNSLIRYGSCIFVLFYGLYLCGFNTAQVITGVSMVSLMISFAAKDIVVDILAGIFILFEGTFSVGDVVTVSGFCGMVTEIGLRTTRIVDRNGNIKTLTNGSINGVLNMSAKHSRVVVKLDIPAKFTSPEVEEMLRVSLPAIERVCPVSHSPIRYMGVDKITQASNTYRLECYCSEEDANDLYRYLNRELLIRLKENGYW